jgi:hypothetical protein
VRRLLVVAAALLASSCVLPSPKPPQPPPDRYVRITAWSKGVAQDVSGSNLWDDFNHSVTCEGTPRLTCKLSSEMKEGNGLHLGLVAMGFALLEVSFPACVHTNPHCYPSQDLPDVELTPLTPPMPDIPTKAELIAAQYTFQGLRASCPQYDPRPLPIFDPMLDVVDEDCKAAILAAHRAAGDKVIGVALSHQYAEPGIIPVLVWGRDWTRDLGGLHDYLTDLIRKGWYIQLHMAMDGHSVRGADGQWTYNDPVGHTYGCEWGAEFFPKLADALDDIHGYIRFLPGYDGVFYGCEDDGLPLKIPAFAAQFKQRWPDAVLGLEFNTGHLPFGEGDADWQPGGRMSNFDMVFAEFDGNLDQDSTWQIVARLMKSPGDYRRPPEQPAGDDPNPPAYLRNWPGTAVCFEWATYDDVRFRITPEQVEAGRQKLRRMGCPHVG